METVSISQRGVERHKAPTLADDGGSIECINLRPTPDGLELAHDKRHLFSATFGADSANDVISAVYRHRALPENHFVVVLNNRKMAVFLEKDDRLSPMTDGQDNIIYFASYDKDIVSIGELNNVLVVRTAKRQDCYLWHEDRYRPMPAIRMPQSMALAQDFTSEKPKNVADRPFFQAVTGFDIPNMDDRSGKNYAEFPDKYNENRDRCLQFVQGLRAEEEANQRRLGKFVGHVLVRCAFKTAQDNYISYGTVLHAEIGAWASTCRTSRFPKSEDAEKNLTPYKRIYRNILRSFADISNNNNQVDNNLIYDTEDKGTNGVAPIPLSCFRSCLKNYSDGHADYMINFDAANAYEFIFDHGESLVSCAGFSQLPVWVGAIPYPVWKSRSFRGNTASNDKRHGISEETQNNKVNPYSGWRAKKSCVGVYAPAIVYSYPILRMVVDDEFVAALEFYKETKIISSLCVAMTAPVKHGIGTTLHKVHTIEKEELTAGFGDDENTDEDDTVSTATRTKEDPGDKDYMYVYGYPRNPDTEPEKLLGKNFYIVKDIDIDELLSMIHDNVIEIPLQLKDIGVIEKTDAYGNTTVETSQEEVDSSQEAQTDPNHVSLNTIESAKILPTDPFSTHTLLGASFMEYNRRLHLFGVSVLMSEGYTPTAAIEYDQKGFGPNRILKKGDSGFVEDLFLEAIVTLDQKTVIRRTPIDSYMTETEPDGSSKGNIILNDILTYPDYRCTKMRLVKQIGDGYHLIGDEFECKSSVLNNLAYTANTFKEVKDLPSITFTSSNGLVIHDRYTQKQSSNVNGSKWHTVRNLTNICNDPDRPGAYRRWSNDQPGLTQKPFSYDASRAMCAYKEDDLLFYRPRVIDLDNIGPEAIDYSGIDDSGTYEDSNRVQVSETNDVFSYPSMNSYRAGSIENRIIAANSVYGQVTEQKFGMFPIYLFTREGIYIMEQGTGNILYSNVSKVNDDVLSDKRSLCNAGNMVTYTTLDGLRLIQGRESRQVSDLANGTPFIDLHGETSPFFKTVSTVPGAAGAQTSFAGYLSAVRLADEIQGCEMLWDSYNRDVVLLCRQGDRAVTWAYNVGSQQFYKRKDVLNDRAGFGVVLNGKNLVWCGSVAVNEIARAAARNIGSGLSGGVAVIPGDAILPPEPAIPVFKFPKGFDIFDFNTSDRETAPDGSPDKQQFLYVSNPIKAGSTGYKHIEHSVLRMFGQDLDMAVEYYGSLDGRKWFAMGGGRISGREEYADMLMRRMPCSTRYIIVVIKGNAAKLQISRLEAEVQARYNTRLR